MTSNITPGELGSEGGAMPSARATHEPSPTNGLGHSVGVPIAFTPGPWDCTGAQFPDDDFGGVYYRVQADGMDMRAANARLISAAPDLLAALEETWRVLRAAGLLNLTNGVQLGQTSWFIKACDAERMSDAAIAKARGQV